MLFSNSNLLSHVWNPTFNTKLCLKQHTHQSYLPNEDQTSMCSPWNRSKPVLFLSSLGVVFFKSFMNFYILGFSCRFHPPHQSYFVAKFLPFLFFLHGRYSFIVFILAGRIYASIFKPLGHHGQYPTQLLSHNSNGFTTCLSKTGFFIVVKADPMLFEAPKKY